MEMDKKFELECHEIGRAHPRLYRSAQTPAGERGWTHCGFAVGCGWLGIIKRLSVQIEEIATRQGLTDEEWPRASQVKEKFGTLCVHVWGKFNSDAWAEIQEAKQAAEAESGKVCGRCGAPGVMRQGGWWHVYCDHCEDLYKKGLL